MRNALQTSSRARRALVSLLACAWVGGALLPLPASALAPDDETFAEGESVAPVEPHARTQVDDTHDPTSAAHPVRIAAYALHPVGVALDWAIVRPAVWVAKREPFRTIFGYED